MCGIDLQIIETWNGANAPITIINSSNNNNGNSFVASNDFGAVDDDDVVHDNSSSNDDPKVVPNSWLRRRGPDHIGTFIVEDDATGDRVISSASEEEMMVESTVGCPFRLSNHYKLTFRASVLNMRDQLVKQPYPIRDEDGTVKYHLAWNGEVYQTIISTTSIATNNNHHPTSDRATLSLEPTTKDRESGSRIVSADDEDDGFGDKTVITKISSVFDDNCSYHDVWQSSISDTELVATMIRDHIILAPLNGLDSSNNDDLVQDREQLILCKLSWVLSHFINAEYSFCLLSDTAVYYGRDPFGKRSLLVGSYYNNNSSDVTPTGSNDDTNDSISRQPIISLWQLASVASSSNSSVCFNNTNWTEVQPGYVFCYNWNTKITTNCSLIPSTRTMPRQYNQLHLIAIKSVEEASLRLEKLLFDAVRRRIGTIDTNTKTHCISILFSGGLDSTVLAALVLQAIPTEAMHKTVVKLINVSFVDDKCANNNNESSNNNNKDNVSASIEKQPIAADTKAAQSSYEELRAIYPNHMIHFIKYSADWNTIQQSESTVRQLMYPKETVMDTNISIALWLAASQVPFDVTTDDDTNDTIHDKEQGARINENQQQRKKSSSSGDGGGSRNRILFTGLGADELMGGYGRHRIAWEEGRSKQEEKSVNGVDGGNAEEIDENNNIPDSDRWKALRNELDLDINRLWERNLGRDDRILSDHSVEVRLPYLDIHVVNFLRYECPIQFLVNYKLKNEHRQGKKLIRPKTSSSIEEDIEVSLPGDKYILRLMAYRMKLLTASSATKRAIQFGSRIAHVSDKQRFGSRRKASGVTVTTSSTKLE